MIELPAQQRYIVEIAEELGIPLAFKEWDGLLTVEEKNYVLNQPFERFVVARYAQHLADKHFVGAIKPDFREYRGTPLYEDSHPQQMLLKAGVPVHEYQVTDQLPHPFIRGTCGPFPYFDSVGASIAQLVIFDHRDLHGTIVDVAVGAATQELERMSVQLPYEGIAAITKKAFGKYVKIVG